VFEGQRDKILSLGIVRMKDRKAPPSLRDLLNGGDLITPEELAAGMRVA